jgi:hypothetical protein
MFYALEGSSAAPQPQPLPFSFDIWMHITKKHSQAKQPTQLNSSISLILSEYFESVSFPLPNRKLFVYKDLKFSIVWVPAHLTRYFQARQRNSTIFVCASSFCTPLLDRIYTRISQNKHSRAADF